MSCTLQTRDGYLFPGQLKTLSSITDRVVTMVFYGGGGGVCMCVGGRQGA